jgi:hypothetical protein
MKILKAKNSINTVEVALADITIDNKPVTEVAEHWAIFPRQYIMALNIAKNGLTFPIIVKKEGDKLLFTASGCRIQYAILNGYTHIDALILEDDAEILATMEAQRVNDNEILEGVSA